MIRNLVCVVCACFAISTAAEQQRSPLAEGLPLPWPFPWARECQVDWLSVAGEYALMENETGDQIELKISIISKVGLRVGRITRATADGKVLSEGFTFVAEGQKTIRLWLYPVDPSEAPTWATIVFYYPSANSRCAMDELVPILTLERAGRNTQYRLVRRRL